MGKVTSNEAILLMETSQNAYVTCTVRDSFTEETKVIMKLLEGRQAQTFHFTCLKPERIYTVTIEGTSVPSDVSVASFKTMPDPIHAVNSELQESVHIRLVLTPNLLQRFHMLWMSLSSTNASLSAL